MKRMDPTRPVALALLAGIAASGPVACRSGIFDNEDPRWRVPDEELRSIDRLDPAAASIGPPTTVEEAERSVLEEVAKPPAADAAVALSLADVRAAVLGGNLDLRTSLVDPAIARANLSAEEAKFEGVFFASYDRSNASLFTDVATGVPASNEAFNAGLRIPLATGGEIDLSTPITQGAAGLQFEPGDDWLAAVSFSISQPLLRGAGIETNTHSIRVAEWQGQIADARTKLEAIRIVSNADKSYWNLYAAYRELDVRRAQYELAVKQLERARRRVAQGEAPQIEVVRAESGIGRTLEQIIVADSNLRIRQRELKRLMNRARMEMLELELQLAVDATNVEVTRNAALPLFSFDFNYQLTGQGDGFGNSVSNIGNDDQFQVGARAEIPITNELRLSQFRRAILQRVQRLATKDARAQSIRQEVLNAVDNLDTAWQRILAARLATIFAARTYQAERRQFEVGLRTSIEVQDAAARLGDAQTREVNALAAYEIALIDAAFATGTLAGGARIRWDQFEARDPSAMPATGIDGTLVPAATRSVPGSAPADVPAS